MCHFEYNRGIKHFLAKLRFSLSTFSSFCIRKRRGIRVRRDLGDVCQNMSNAAGNNMVVGTDMTVDTSSTATNLFTVTSTGQTKLNQTVYTSFKGKSYSNSLLLYVILLTEN